MGIIRQGIFGGFEGKTGGLIGRKINGKSVISALPHKTTKESSQAQLDQQLKFELVANALKRLRRLIAIGFKHIGHKNAFNAAMKYNFKNIVTGTSPAYEIDYSKLVFSRGNLAGANAPAISLGTNAVVFSWQPDAQTQFNRRTDKASFLIYCPEKNIMVSLIEAVERQALGYSMAIPPNFAGLEMLVFMSFTRADGKEVSNSECLGTI